MRFGAWGMREVRGDTSTNWNGPMADAPLSPRVNTFGSRFAVRGIPNCGWGTGSPWGRTAGAKRVSCERDCDEVWGILGASPHIAEHVHDRMCATTGIWLNMVLFSAG